VSRGGKHVRIVAERDAFGAVAAMARDMRASASIAVTDTVVLAIRAEDLLEVLEDHFDVMHAALRRLAHVAIEMRRTLMPHAGFSNELRDGFEFPARPLAGCGKTVLRRSSCPQPDGHRGDGSGETVRVPATMTAAWATWRRDPPVMPKPV
jgi:hypothetical protein